MRAHRSDVDDHRLARAPAPVGSRRRLDPGPVWRGGSSIIAGGSMRESLIALQRTAGNAAVRRLVDQSARGLTHVQRCGSTACDCTDDQHAQRGPNSGPARESAMVQRFGSGEHVRIGGEALPGQTVLLTGYGKITYGEMIALGDYFGSLSEMNILASAMGTWGREQLDYALWKVNPVSPANPTGRPRPSVSPSAEEAVNGRYYRLAARNEPHFSTGSLPGQSNREQYIAGHTAAVRSAYFEGSHHSPSGRGTGRPRRRSASTS